MSTVTKPILKDESFNTQMARLIKAVSGKAGTTSWADIQRNVQLGFGPELYPVGSKLYCTHTAYTNIEWDVVGHDIVKNALGDDLHTMQLLSHNCLANVQFDSPEAIIACDTALTNGTTYHFNCNGVSYEFTASADFPIGTQLMVSANTEYVPTKLKAYTKWTNTQVGTEMTVATGSSGTAIPDTSVNHIHRWRYGSNNYAESAIVQFMNSEAAAGSVWSGKTKYDRPPSWLSTQAGFLNGIQSEFKAALCTSKVKCSTNNTFESQDSAYPKNTAYVLEDKIFLVSRVEINHGAGDVADGSVLFPYYSGCTNDDRIKLLSGSPRYWWYRTPYSGDARYVRGAYTDGSLANRVALDSLGFAPACSIG